MADERRNYAAYLPRPKPVNAAAASYEPPPERSPIMELLQRFGFMQPQGGPQGGFVINGENDPRLPQLEKEAEAWRRANGLRVSGGGRGRENYAADQARAREGALAAEQYAPMSPEALAAFEGSMAPTDDIGFDGLPTSVYAHRGGQAQRFAASSPQQPAPQTGPRDLAQTRIADWTPQELQAYGRGEGRMAQGYDPQDGFGISGQRMLLEQANREREGQFFSNLGQTTDAAIRRSTDVDAEYQALQGTDRQNIFPNLRYGETEHKALKSSIEAEIAELLEVERRARERSAQRRKGFPSPLDLLVSR